MPPERKTTSYEARIELLSLAFEEAVHRSAWDEAQALLDERSKAVEELRSNGPASLDLQDRLEVIDLRLAAFKKQRGEAIARERRAYDEALKAEKAYKKGPPNPQSRLERAG